MDYTDIIKKLYIENDLSDNNLVDIISTDGYDNELFELADEKRRQIYGDEVYVRGLIEFTNFCRNDCFYCGIRNSNTNAMRYRMDFSEIMSTCKKGYDLGVRTFVLQGGEDPYYTDEKICSIVSEISQKFPDCVITLSIGEKTKESYQKYYNAGARRYLLRHETADENHYKMMHPEKMRLENRKKCLFDLKEIGYQTGAGFMVGSPYQNPGNLVSDIRFLQKLQPDMIGIGPFIPQSDTPFAGFEAGTLELTLRMVALLRLLFPYALIPATTALGTIHPEGRERALKAGANVIMPNITGSEYRKKYLLYDNKICTGEEPEMCIGCISKRVEKTGLHLSTGIGDVKRK